MMRQKVLGILMVATFLLMIPGQAFAATCYPPAKTDGSRVYLGTVGSNSGSRTYLYGVFLPNTATKINRIDVVGYMWKGVYCTSTDTYFGRMGFSMYDDKNGRHCVDSLYVQFQKSPTSWPTINIPGGWCGKWGDMPIYITVAVVPVLIEDGAAAVVTYISDIFKAIVKLPWPSWFKLPHPVPTYI